MIFVGAIQDRIDAQAAIPTDGQQADQIIRGAVKEEIENLLSDPSPEELNTLMGISNDIDAKVDAHIKQEIDEAIEDAIEDL